MLYGTPEFVALVRDAFDHELSRSGDRANALGAAVGAAIAAGARWDPVATLDAIRAALSARLTNPPTPHEEAEYLARRVMASRVRVVAREADR